MINESKPRIRGKHKHLAALVYNARKEQRLTRAELTSELGEIGNMCIYRIECAQARYLDHIKEISERLKIDIDDLMDALTYDAIEEFKSYLER